jgi:hypothetical protein
VIRGFQLMENIKNGTIGNIFEEFNSIAWGTDIGGNYTAPFPNPEPPPPGSPPMKREA